MKKFFIFLSLSLIMFVFLLSGCSNKKNNALKVGIYQTTPYVMSKSDVPITNQTANKTTPFNTKQKFTGFDIEIIEAIAKKMNVELDFVNSSFTDLFNGIKNKEYNLAIGNISITNERSKEFAFSEPYLESGNCLVAFRGDTITRKEHLAGRNIGALFGTTMFEKAQSITGANVIAYDSPADMYLALFNGDIDAIVMDKNQAAYDIKERKLKRAAIIEIFDSEPLGIMLPKDNPELLEKVNKALKELKESGEYQAIYSKWFGLTTLLPTKTLPNQD